MTLPGKSNSFTLFPSQMKNVFFIFQQHFLRFIFFFFESVCCFCHRAGIGYIHQQSSKRSISPISAFTGNHQILKIKIEANDDRKQRRQNILKADFIGEILGAQFACMHKNTLQKHRTHKCSRILTRDSRPNIKTMFYSALWPNITISAQQEHFSLHERSSCPIPTTPQLGSAAQVARCCWLMILPSTISDLRSSSLKPL